MGFGGHMLVFILPGEVARERELAKTKTGSKMGVKRVFMVFK